MKSNPITHIFLALATFITLTLKDYIFPPYEEDFVKLVLSEIPYSTALFIILFAHEMGHYIPARFYGISSTLPYFIPMPFGPIGTMGAVIKIQEPIPDKKKLFDIGIGGPLMSFVLSVPCWILGLYWSEIIPIGDHPSSLDIPILGDSLFTHYSTIWVHRELNPLEEDILIHPLAKAGWVGLVITAINLLPFGQLDGGHVIYSLFGEKYRNWIYYLFIAFLGLGFVSFTWVIWGLILFFGIKVEHPYVPDSVEKLGAFRVFLGGFMLLSLIFIFVPIPISTLREMNSTFLYEDILRLFF